MPDAKNASLDSHLEIPTRHVPLSVRYGGSTAVQPGMPASAPPISRIDRASASLCPGWGQWKTMKMKLMSRLSIVTFDDTALVAGWPRLREPFFLGVRVA